MSLEVAIHRVVDALFRLADEPVRGRMLFKIGPVAENEGGSVPTPQHQRQVAGEIEAMFTMTATQKATATVAFRDRKGNPVGASDVSWGVDNSDVLAIAPSADGLSCEFSAVGPLGTALLSVQADADLGDGVKPVAGTLEVTVTPGMAETVEITAGAPVEQ